MQIKTTIRYYLILIKNSYYQNVYKLKNGNENMEKIEP